MKVRDTLMFALELFVPERLLRARQTSASDPDQKSSKDIPAILKNAEGGGIGRARMIIEELDHGQFGGPSFGLYTLELMSKTLLDAEASLPQPVTSEQLRMVAAIILKVAGDGERDPARLKAAAISALATEPGEPNRNPPEISQTGQHR